MKLLALFKRVPTPGRDSYMYSEQKHALRFMNYTSMVSAGVFLIIALMNWEHPGERASFLLADVVFYLLATSLYYFGYMDLARFFLLTGNVSGLAVLLIIVDLPYAAFIVSPYVFATIAILTKDKIERYLFYGFTVCLLGCIYALYFYYASRTLDAQRYMQGIAMHFFLTMLSCLVMLGIIRIWAVQFRINKDELRDSIARKLYYQHRREKDMLKEFGDITHEMRQHLSLFNAIVYAQPKSPDQGLTLNKEQTLLLTSATGTLLQLINQVQRTTKDGLQKFYVLEPVNFDVIDLIDLICKSFLVQARQKGSSIYWSTSGKVPPLVRMDKNKLQVVLTNLISNAVKFSPENSEVRIEAHFGTQTMELHIKDQGPGIAGDQKEQIFERYYAEPGQPIEEGSGIGLPLTKQFVQFMHGHISILDGESGGSIFIVELPLVFPRRGQGTSEKPNRIAKIPKGLRALVLDDNQMSLKSLDIQLRGIGCHTTLAEDILQAKHVLLEMRPDFIVMDLNLEDNHFLEFLSALKSNDETEKIPFIVVSGDFELEQKREELLRRGAAAVLPKPVAIADLTTEISALNIK